MSAKGPAFVSFDYMYRDGHNYKNAGETVIFANPDGIGIEEADQRILAKLKELGGLMAEWFIADQFGIPEVFCWDEYPPDDFDSCWHEYLGLQEEMGPATDKRTLREFVEAIVAVEKWIEFTPEAHMRKKRA